jgi:hypothetical protein
VESTVAEVLILHGLDGGGYYEVVTPVVLKSLGEFEGRRGGGAWLYGEGGEGPCPNQRGDYNILVLIVKCKL